MVQAVPDETPQPDCVSSGSWSDGEGIYSVAVIGRWLRVVPVAVHRGPRSDKVEHRH